MARRCVAHLGRRHLVDALHRHARIHDAQRERELQSPPNGNFLRTRRDLHRRGLRDHGHRLLVHLADPGGWPADGHGHSRNALSRHGGDEHEGDAKL
jgi:hypothetical protein